MNKQSFMTLIVLLVFTIHLKFGLVGLSSQSSILEIEMSNNESTSVCPTVPTNFEESAGGFFETDSISQKTSSGSWTILIYHAADNNLEPFAVDTISMCECIGSTTDVNMIYYVDFLDGAYGPTSSARCYNITYDVDSSTIQSEELVTSLPDEPDMADGQVLHDFIVFGKIMRLRIILRYYFLIMVTNHIAYCSMSLT